MKRWLLVALLAAGPAGAQPGSILLVAKPGMPEPNFRESVIVVTRAGDGSTVGVILNRPTRERHEKFAEPLYAGGPVMRKVVVAMFAAEEPPSHAAFEILPHVYLTMHPQDIEALVARPAARATFFRLRRLGAAPARGGNRRRCVKPVARARAARKRQARPQRPTCRAILTP
jgi:hypothetical protein